ncbi:MAG: ATP-binding cassette domain-containing protein, partial [Melioribacteraceae bacterium]|nr:ATP-binding cassette domain-containing protein [Melioribacteraceae bacterium]
PILITAITTIVAMIPLSLGRAEYVTTIGAPFAITVIGGLSLSTVFTLIFIPTLYSGLHSSLEWLKSLDWKIKTLQIIVFLFFSYLIYFKIDSFVWQMVNLFLVIIVIPGLTYFIMTSLRQAKTKLISADDEINIEVKNVVKIFDQPSRFKREWNRGKLKEKVNRESEKSYKRSDQLIWQIPLLGFLIYFIYFYMEIPFWQFVLVHILYFYTLYLLKNVISVKVHSNTKSDKKLFNNFNKNLSKSFFWLFPLFNLVLFQILWDNIAIVIFIFILWYSALIINTTAQNIYMGKLNTTDDKARFSGLKLKFYSLIKLIPIIGKKNIPFKALNSVSVDIGSGMFGLLGPNGAGKTTLMRIICGILEQSYGKVRINGLDRQEYHEELQGLIGYLPQEFGMYENMTAYEFLDYQAMLKNISDNEKRKERIVQVLKSVHMFERKDEKISSYSGGMKQRIGIAQILLHLPRILVVDEPTAGLDPRERIRFRNLLVELSRERVVIFSTHIIEDISSSCSRVAVLNLGEVR